MTRILSLVLIFTVSVFAQLSPGDLARPHADLEGLTNCTKCHEFGKKLQFNKCLDCHEILKQRIDAGKGLHANDDYKNCTDCHHDHQGRNFDMVWWEKGQDNLDHKLTGYVLEGKHKDVKCRECHQEKNIVNREALLEKSKKTDRTFLGLQQDCLSCHHDEHRGQTGKKECLSCHDMNAWKPVPKFDHDKSQYPLTGLHKKVKCEKCHKLITDNKFEKDKDYIQFRIDDFKNCLSCHKDIHNGKFGNDCTKCHTTNGWKKYNDKQFNHDKTRYPLRGLHQKVDCVKCHVKGAPLSPIPFKQCSDCHFDIHFGQFNDREKKGICEECHNVYGFQPSLFTIELHNKSKYKLEGAHLAVPCLMCHATVAKGRNNERMQFTFRQTKCEDCHTDIHKGEVDKYKKINGCEHCHNVDTWHSVKFDHKQTKFPLEGRHENVACVKCHKPVQIGTRRERYKFLKVSVNCVDCHEDIHLGQFADSRGAISCEKCHTPKDWFAEKFEHNRDSRYKVEGAHLAVKCEGCHKTETRAGKKFVMYKPIDTACSNCHKGSEILKGAKRL